MSKRLDNNEGGQKEAGREPLPSLIYNEVNFEDREEETTEVPKKLRPNPPPHPSAIRWLWTGVICFAAVIILMWGWSLKNQLTTINWKDSSEVKIIDSAKENWEEVFTGNWSEEVNKMEAKTKLQEVIAAIKQAAITSPTTTSSTTPNPPTTTTGLPSTTKK